MGGGFRGRFRGDFRGDVIVSLYISLFTWMERLYTFLIPWESLGYPAASSTMVSK